MKFMGMNIMSEADAEFQASCDFGLCEEEDSGL